MLVAARSVSIDDYIEILMNSKLTIEELTKFFKKHKDEGWLEVENKEILRVTILLLRSRRGQTILIKVKGHSNLKKMTKHISWPEKEPRYIVGPR